MEERSRGTELIVAGDINVDPEKVDGRGRDKEIAAAVATSDLEDVLKHFLPRRRAWCKDRRRWEMVRQGRVVRSRKDYILGYGRLIFQNVSVQDLMRNYDHFMVVGCLRGASLREQFCYLWRKIRHLLRPTGRQTRTREAFQ